MKLTRAIPAFLALSLLTGCDIDGLMAGFNTDGKNGKGGDIIEENKVTPAATWESLTEEEKTAVNSYTELAIDAASQGLAAAGTFDALKSVSALTSNSAYRISSDAPTVDLSKLPGLGFDLNSDGPAVGKAWSSTPKDVDNGKFKGKQGKYQANDAGTGYYLAGEFTPVQDFVTQGQAILKLSSDTELDMNAIQNFQAEAEIDVTIKGVPASVATVSPIKDSRVELSLKKKETTSTLLDGTFKLSKNGNTSSQGEITIDLKDSTWSVVIPVPSHGREKLYVSLTTEPNGAGQAFLYGETADKIDYNKKRATYIWDDKGKLTVSDIYVATIGQVMRDRLSVPYSLPPMIFTKASQSLLQ